MEYTQGEVVTDEQANLLSLNPCCNGIYSMSGVFLCLFVLGTVLILVVMEYTQWDYVRCYDKQLKMVLILVVMEYTQWV